jgi:hypothetical protein
MQFSAPFRKPTIILFHTFSQNFNCIRNNYRKYLIFQIILSFNHDFLRFRNCLNTLMLLSEKLFSFKMIVEYQFHHL